MASLDSLKDEPEIVEMPAEIEVTDALSLSAEVDRLLPLLSSVNGTPWTIRVGGMKRISQLNRDAASKLIANFPEQMLRFKQPLVEQLTDRRSQVVKQACATISTLSTFFKDAYLQEGTANALKGDRLEEARKVWLELTLHFIEHLLPVIPVTVQVINSAACLCLSAILKNIAPLYRANSNEYEIMQYLLNQGITHKHGIVRDHCFRGISNCIMRLDPRYVERETKNDKEEASKIEKQVKASQANKNSDEPDSESAPVNSSSSASSSEAGSPLLHKLESAIQNGINDSFDKTRAAARLSLIQFQTLAPARANRIISQMNAAQGNMFQKHKADYETNKSLAGELKPKSESASSTPVSSASNNIADEPPHHASDDELEAELNPAPKTAGSKLPTSKASASASSGLKSQIAAQKKAAKGKKKKGPAAAGSKDASEEEEEDVVASKPVKAKKVEEVRKVSEDEADEESSPVVESGKGKQKGKKNKGKKHDSSKDNSEEDNDDEEKAAEEAKSSKADSKPSGASSAVMSGQYARNFTLLSKLLDLDNPMLTDKMIDFLLHEGVIDVFIAFISRVGENDVDMDELALVKNFKDLGAQYTNTYEAHEERGADCPPDSDVPFTHRIRPSEDDAAEQTAVRRSYHVMQILTGQKQSQSLMAVLTPKIPTIVLKLMCVFHPKSQGNFYHACGVLQKLITTFPGTVLTALCSPSGRVLMGLMFDHLHEAPVIPCLLNFIQSSIEYKVNGKTEPSDLVLHLNKLDIVNSKLIPRIVAPPSQVSRLVSQASTDFLVQFVEKLQGTGVEKQSQNMGRFLQHIGEEGKGVEVLTQALTDHETQRPTWQLSNIGLLLYTFLTACSEEQVTVTETDMQAQAMAQMMGQSINLTKKLPNVMFPHKKEVQRSMSSRFASLCQMLVAGESVQSVNGSNEPHAVTVLPSSLHAHHHPAVQFSSYHIPASFTSKRLQTFKLIIKLINNDIDLAISEAEQLKARKARLPNTILPSTPLQVVSAPRLFSLIPQHTWQVLLDWFFRFTHNNFFLGNFKQLFLAIVKYTVAVSQIKEEQKNENGGAASSSAPAGIPSCPTDDVLKFVLQDCKFLSRMVAFYTTPNQVASCTCSYILDLSNHLRLSADLLSHSCFLWTFLQSSQQWHDFLPVLQAESLKQSRNLHQKPIEDAPPVNPERAALERALGFSLGGGGEGPPPNPDAFIVPEGYGEGIDLGSVFAWHLGYKQKSGVDKGAGSTRKNKKKNKKKKKKNAKKKAEAEAAANGASDDEGSDEEDASGTGAESDSSTASSNSANSSPAKKPTLIIKGSPTNTSASSAASSAALRAKDVTNSVAIESPSQEGTMLQSPSPPVSPQLNGGAKTLE